MSRFIAQNNIEAKLVIGNTLTLSREESHHLSKVLRLEVGENVQVIDGKGTLCQARIVDNSRNASVVQILSVEQDLSKSKMTLAFGVSKSNAMEFLIRRATEIGVGAFQPLLTQHSLHPDSWNEERWKKLIMEVSKQCELLVFPEILQPLKFSDWLKTRNPENDLVYSYENSRSDKPTLSLDVSVDLLIGSEGGFSLNEIKEIQSHGGKSLGLGKNKLRVETASIVAIVLLKEKLGEI